MKVAVVGVTGLVGTVMTQLLEERNFPVTEFIPVASARSVGKSIQFKKEQYHINSMEEAVSKSPDIALFSAGGSVSKEWAPRFAQNGTRVIDNSSAWRMDTGKKLVVPEVNAKVLTSEDMIIANPNCSTIQLVIALSPLHDAYGINRMVVSTYQSFTGTGANAVHQYKTEKEQGVTPQNAPYPHPIFENCLPHCDVFNENGYTKEELKIINETRKILNDKDIRITSTAVRVPVFGGHSESINLEFEKDFELSEVISLLDKQEGITLLDDPANNVYPTPLAAHGKDDVFVGRIRRDHSLDNGLNLWVVSDNLRKGAATNAIQIAEYLLKNELITNRKMVNQSI